MASKRSAGFPTIILICNLTPLDPKISSGLPDFTLTKHLGPLGILLRIVHTEDSLPEVPGSINKMPHDQSALISTLTDTMEE